MTELYFVKPFPLFITFQPVASFLDVIGDTIKASTEVIDIQNELYKYSISPAFRTNTICLSHMFGMDLLN